MLFLVVLLLSVLAVIFNRKDLSYLRGPGEAESDDGIWTDIKSVLREFPKALGLYIVLISHTIPMSIYAAIEILKAFQQNNI